MNSFPYTFGIEEEYFLALAADGSLAPCIPDHFLARAHARLGDAVTSELLQSQIEIASPVLSSMREAREQLMHLRSALAQMLAEEDLQLIAASTHPLGAWREQQVTVKPRYDRLLSDFRIVGQRNLVCGMHVHVEIPAGTDRVRLMNRIMPWLPVFLALSTSSPFWDQRVTGLMSYRQAIYDEWPRSGIPDFFDDEADYDAFATLLHGAGALADASFLWWAIRPAMKFPTLELRIADVCTSADDALALAALFRCLIAMLVRNPQHGAQRSTHTRRLIDENRWRAKRDSTGASLIDEGSGSAVPMRQVIANLVDLVAEDAQRLECVPELQHLTRILDRGTSAHAQLRIYNDARAAGDSQDRALRRVVEWLSNETTATPADA
ncbi:MAG TPA: carboxylate-amine ligase [Povalibacter sp.]|uniref:carboxylate-amine ligase n=1 Tax=Povalibacter sp. TaxID=1962978 RepID=UPI002CF7E064|nr:carboxylate-amine ligase [Povalibacter sp.]HMN46163.1 carboxylate-amine ligase [Povalibacter sp.]